MAIRAPDGAKNIETKNKIPKKKQEHVKVLKMLHLYCGRLYLRTNLLAVNWFGLT